MLTTKRTTTSPDHHEVQIGNLTLHYSFETLIAFETPTELVISENQWTAKTGQHLNEVLTNKEVRLAPEVFDQHVEALIAAINEVVKPNPLDQLIAEHGIVVTL